MSDTPRTEITFTGAYTCTNHNDRQRAECPVCLVSALTAERDQLRSEFEKLAITTAQAQDRNVSYRLERDKAKAEAERTDAIYQRACEVERELRAEVKRMTHAYEYDHKCLYEVRNRCHLWKQRAIKAEAELAAERARLQKIALDACMSAQIKPLVWYPKGYVIDPNDLGKINEHQVEACVAAIDVALKEDA